MIGMVLVTHGRLATEFRAALEHVVGPQTQLETITIGPRTTWKPVGARSWPRCAE
jgi:mannose/fructose-specific phosphotransferase system component IIA